MKKGTRIYTRPSNRSKVVATLGAGALLVVTKEFIGTSGNWHMVRVVEPENNLSSYRKPLFVSSKAVRKFSDTNIVESHGESSLPLPSLPRNYQCKSKQKSSSCGMGAQRSQVYLFG